jgi:hypothetical protein
LSEPITPVIFRRWPKERQQNLLTGKMEWLGGDVFAIFPTEPGTYEPWTFACYAHVGQHGTADKVVIGRTRKATPDQYADLKKELESAPYGYRLRVYTRWQRSFDEAREQSLKEARGC